LGNAALDDLLKEEFHKLNSVTDDGCNFYSIISHKMKWNYADGRSLCLRHMPARELNLEYL
jgi:hypothetical protein